MVSSTQSPGSVTTVSQWNGTRGGHVLRKEWDCACRQHSSSSCMFDVHEGPKCTITKLFHMRKVKKHTACWCHGMRPVILHAKGKQEYAGMPISVVFRGSPVTHTMRTCLKAVCVQAKVGLSELWLTPSCSAPLPYPRAFRWESFCLARKQRKTKWAGNIAWINLVLYGHHAISVPVVDLIAIVFWASFTSYFGSFSGL